MARTRSLYPDTLFASTYQIICAVGGGRAEVYRAKDTALDRHVALKLLRPGGAPPGGSWVAALGREGRTTAHVRCHPFGESVVEVYRSDAHDGIRFVAFEWLAGGDAETWARQVRPTLERPWEQATRIATDTCRGLIAAHESGTLHLDVKPANILLTEEGAAKLGDFEVATELGPDGTCCGPHPGTRGYAAPEQAAGLSADPRSDLYALGATYFHLLAGRPPDRPGQSPRAIDAAIPEACAAVAQKAIEAVPGARYQTAREMLAALAAAADEIRDDALARYLNWVRAANGTLRLPVLNVAVELDRVYTALRVDPTTDRERRLTLQLQEAVENLPGSAAADRVAEIPFTLTLEEGAGGRSLTLAQAYQYYPVLVILGDPGSGKTTLARWLARAAAEGWAGDGGFVVETRRIDPERPDDTTGVRLGPRRLPVLIRAADYSRFRQQRRLNDGPPAPLLDYLGRPAPDRVDDGPTDAEGRPIGGDRTNELVRRAVRNRAALVIIDGLDEIPDDEERRSVRSAVQAFIRDHVAVDPTGNRVIVTSRVVGYQVAPLEGDLVGQVKVERMGRAAIEHFVRAWLRGCGAADARADVLLSQIDPKVRPELWDMSANPLLCGVLTAVFHQRDGTLPATRVELYRQAVDEFLTVWERRTVTVGHTPMGREEVVQLLERVAAFYHRSRPTGMLSGDELRARLVHLRCEQLHVAETLEPPAAVVDGVSALMTVLREPIGLLVPRYEGVYGFIHLTFQEYLAARALARGGDVPGVFANLRPVLDTTRWREPVLMALGEFARKHPDRLVELARLVVNEDGRFGELLPRGALTVVAALPDLPHRPPELIALLVERLLAVYAGPSGGPSHFDRLREIVEAAVGGDGDRQRSMRQLAPAATERALAAALRRREMAPPAAALVRRLEWFTRPIGETLLEARAYDSPEWDWPIHGALREMATCPPPPRAPYAPPEVKAHQNLRAALGAATDPAQQTRLAEQLAAHEREHGPALAAHQTAADRHAADMARYESVGRLAPRVELPTIDLPFRRAVESDPALARRIAADLDWLRVVLILYGGAGDFRAGERMKEYRQYSNFLQLGATIRKVFLATHHHEQWGKDDPVYRIAVHLDTRGTEWAACWTRPPEFNPRFVADDSPLTPVLLPALRAGRSVRELVPELLRLAGGGTIPEQVDACAALVALVVEITPEFAAVLVRPHVRERFHRAAAALSDPLLRAANRVVPGLLALLRAGRPGTWPAWAALADAAVGMVAPGNPLAIDTQGLCGGTAARPEPLAELLASRFLGIGQDDAVYHAAVLLDTFTAKTMRPDTFFRAIALVPLCRHRRASVRAYPWEIEQVPPRRLDPDDLPGFVLTALENIHPELSMTRGWAVVEMCLPVARVNPNLVPELLALTARDTGDRSDRDYALRALAPDLVGHPDLAREARRRAEALTDPYHRGRALLRLLPLFLAEGPAIRGRVLDDARGVPDPFRRSQVYERLLAVTPLGAGSRRRSWWPRSRWAADVNDRAGLLAESLRTVRAIRDPDDRARALARLSAQYPAGERARVLAEAVRTAALIPEPYARAETLRLLFPQVVAFPDVVAQVVAAADAIGHIGARAAARDWLIVPLIQALPMIEETYPDGASAWSVLSTAAAVRDVIPDAWAALDPVWMWANLREHAADGAAYALYSRGQDEGLSLTRAAAEVLDQLAPTEVEEYAPLVPLLQSPEPEAMPVVHEWFAARPGPLRGQAALLLAEREGVRVELLPHVFAALRSFNDLTRIRAAQVIHHPLVCPEVPARRLSVVGRSVVEAVTREALAVGRDEPDVAARLSWMGQDVLFDDDAAVRDWLAAIRADPLAGRPVAGRLDPGGDPGRPGVLAERVLRMIEAVTDPVWDALMSGLEAGPVPVRTAALIVLMRLAYRTVTASPIRLTPARWARAAEVLGRLGRSDLPDTPILLGGPAGLIRAAAAAAGPGDAVERARRFHADLFTVRLGDLLTTPPRNPDAERLPPLPGFTGDDAPTPALTWLRYLASQHLYASGEPEHYLAPTEAARQLLRESPAALEVLCDWLTAELPTLGDYTLFFQTADELLVATAQAAAVEPRAFESYTGRDRLRVLLSVAARRARTRLGRAAAVTLLGRLRLCDREVAEAFAAAALGVDDLRQAAQTAATHFRPDNTEFLPILAGRPDHGTGLYHPSGVVAYQYGLILEGIGRGANGAAGDQIRTEVLLALATAIRHPATNRAVHFGHTLSHLPDNPRLNQLLLRILLRTAGVE